MGTSTDAYLFKGFEFHDEEGNQQTDWMYEWGDSWEEYYLNKIGYKDTSGFYTKDGEYAFKEGTEEFEIAKKKRDEGWEEKRDIIGKLTHNGKIGISLHCSCECPIWYIHLENISASRGYSTDIDISKMTITINDCNILSEFCKKMDIKYQDPEWILASYWG
jgi:hypothetical protein